MLPFRVFIILLIISKLDDLAAIPQYEEILNLSNSNAHYFTYIRRNLHKSPEVAYSEVKTSKIIQEVLTDNNISFTTGWGLNDMAPPKGGTGVVAEIGSGQSPCIALRADIDALPIEELVDSPFKSQIPGFMHACGHDSHTAMLLGAAVLLKHFEDQIHGTVRLIFQPAEEGGAGALMMLREGVLSKEPPVERIFGFHIDPKTPTGTVVSRPGSIWGGTSGFIIQLVGKGGHAAIHHQTIDPIVAGMALIRGIYDICSRELYFQHQYAGAISVTYVNTSSSAPNIVPGTIAIGGTIRALETSTLEMIIKRIHEVANHIGSTYHCSVTFSHENFKLRSPRPTVYNDPALYKLFKNIISDAVLGNYIELPEPELVSEDFSYFGQVVPAVFSFLGIGGPDNHPPTNINLHNPHFFLDERILPIGAALHTHLAIQNLIELHSNNSPLRELQAQS